MQKEGPIVTFSHVVKKIRAERFTWKKKFLQKQWAKKNIRASWKFPTPHHFSNGPSLSSSRYVTLMQWRHSLDIHCDSEETVIMGSRLSIVSIWKCGIVPSSLLRLFCNLILQCLFTRIDLWSCTWFQRGLDLMKLHISIIPSVVNRTGNSLFVADFTFLTHSQSHYELFRDCGNLSKMLSLLILMSTLINSTLNHVNHWYVYILQFPTPRKRTLPKPWRARLVIQRNN